MSPSKLHGVLLLASSLCACTPPPAFPVVSAPPPSALAPVTSALTEKVPDVPKPRPTSTGKVSGAWKVVDRSNKLPLRKRSLGLKVSRGKVVSVEVAGADTAQLMMAMMGKGFSSLVDLSEAQSIDAEVTRAAAGNTVTLRGKLDAMLRVNSPLRTDLTLLVSVVGLAGAGVTSLDFDARDLEAYARSYEEYRRAVERYLTTNEEVTKAYRDEFAKARQDYQAKPKGLSGLTQTPSPEARATEEYTAQVKQLLQLHEDAKQALARVPTPEQVKATGGASRPAPVGVRLVGTAEVIEAASNRILWLGLLDLSDLDEETARSRAVEALVEALPPT